MRNILPGTCVFIFFAVAFLSFSGCSKKNDAETLVIHPTINPAPYSVLVYLITPTDKSFNPQYYTVAKSCILNLQNWYKSQLGNGKTFLLNPVVVDTLTGLHNSAWFNIYNGDGISSNTLSYAYHNTKYELRQLLGAKFDTTLYTYFVYVSADFPDETIPRGLAAEGSSNLEGLEGNSPDIFIGGAGHSLGHAFGLPEVPVENSDGIMSLGFPKYPHCLLQQSEKDSLNASPFFQIR